MTTQDQIIIICVLAFIAVPLGTFITIKTINKLSRPPVNTLDRRGDIELVDYIEPSQPIHAYYPFDINNNFPTYERISYPPTYYTGSNPPFYQSGTLPRYQSVETINCPLELDFISWLIFLSILIAFIIIIFKYFNSKVLILTLFCFIFGLFMNSLYAMSILIPFSSFDIDFRDSFEWKFNSYGVKPKISYLKLQSLTKDINLLLLSLVDDVNYSMSLSYISSYKEWKDNKEKVHALFIDDAIIVNKESDPILITEFIMESLNDKGLFETNSLFNDSLINSMDPIILTVTVSIKVKI